MHKMWVLNNVSAVIIVKYKKTASNDVRAKTIHEIITLDYHPKPI